MDNKDLKNKTLSGLTWKLLENFGAQFISLVIQIILARILMPEDYSIIALATVFIAIGNVFIQTGFAPALIQKNEVNELELSSVFHLGILVSLSIYFIIYVSAPFISNFYEEQTLTGILRIQSITIIFASISSVHNALLVRSLQFKKMFKFRTLAFILQGIVGIFLATQGFGVWALVYANMVNSITMAISLFIVIDWRPKLVFSISKINKLFSFSSRILIMNLSNTIYNNIKSLIIGKSFEPAVLGYYNRGIQIPTLIMVNTDGAINTVMFPVLSSCQNDRSAFLSAYRRSLKTSCYLVFPMMIGLAAVAKPLTLLLLTDKWLPSVPFMIIACLTCMTWPFSIRIQAFNAIGRSDVSLKLNIIGKTIGILFMLISLPFGVYAFVVGFLISSIIGVSIGAIVSVRILGYKIVHQIKDVLPSLILSLFMGVVVTSMNLIFDNILLSLGIQVIVGVVIYIGGSYILKLESFHYLYRIVTGRIRKNEKIRRY